MARYDNTSEMICTVEEKDKQLEKTTSSVCCSPSSESVIVQLHYVTMSILHVMTDLNEWKAVFAASPPPELPEESSVAQPLAFRTESTLPGPVA
jgi:hypothetical protein